MAKTKTPKRPRKMKQGNLPGMEVETHLDVEEASDAYLEARNSRMEKTKVEVETKTKLLDLMKAHKLTKYDYDGHRVEFTRGVNEDVKVKSVKEDVQVDPAESNGEAES